MTGGVQPITTQERAARVAKAQQLMAQHKISALVLEGGSSMCYFTGIRWGLSERPFCGAAAQRVKPPGDSRFEEERARELVGKRRPQFEFCRKRRPTTDLGISGSRRRQRGVAAKADRFFVYSG